MSIADEIRKLHDLHWNGALTDAEFARAKAALLAPPPPPPPAVPAPVPVVAPAPPADDPAVLRYRAELARLDRAWAAERERYVVTGFGGRRYVPTVGEGMAAAAAVAVLGGAVAAAGVVLAGGLPGGVATALAKGALVLLGLYAAVAGVRIGVATVGTAADYRRAYAAYLRRRAAVKADDFR